MTDSTLPGLDESDALATLTPADADRFRLVVTPDTDADGPIQWGHLTVLDLRPDYRSATPTGGTDPVDLARALERFRDTLPTTDLIAAATIRWAAIFLGVTVQRWRPSGYTQSAWGDGLAYLETDEARTGTLAEQGAELAGWLTNADAWYRGEVYGVRLERNAETDADAEPVWVELNDCALWGNYLDADYTAAHVAADSFGVPLEFAQAVTVQEGDW